MKPDSDSLDELLDELMPAEGRLRRDDLLALVRHERRRRQRRRVLMLALPLVLAAAWFGVPRPGAPEPQAAPHVAAASKPLTIERVNDEQLLALLEGTPAALMHWPDGRRTLLVLPSPAAGAPVW